jgi:hypothetical protein
MALTEEQLRLLSEAKEVRIETSSSRGPRSTIIWIVVVDGRVYVRSVRAEEGHWYRRALSSPDVAILVAGQRIPFRAVLVEDPEEIDQVTEALRAKYPAGGSLDRMTRDEVLAHTLRLEPV